MGSWNRISQHAMVPLLVPVEKRRDVKYRPSPNNTSKDIVINILLFFTKVYMRVKKVKFVLVSYKSFMTDPTRILQNLTRKQALRLNTQTI